MSDTTNAQTAALATETQALPLRRLQLIGVAGTEETPRALLRTPAGQITTVERGDAIRQGTVIAIGANSVTLSGGGGRTTVLHMPDPEQSRSAA